MSQLIRLKRSQTLGKRLLANSLSSGELFLNYNEVDPGVFFRDNSLKLRKVGAAHVGINPPNSDPLPGSESGVSEGELWYCTNPSNPNFETLLIYVGGAWKTIT